MPFKDFDENWFNQFDDTYPELQVTGHGQDLHFPVTQASGVVTTDSLIAETSTTEVQSSPTLTSELLNTPETIITPPLISNEELLIPANPLTNESLALNSYAFQEAYTLYQNLATEQQQNTNKKGKRQHNITTFIRNEWTTAREDDKSRYTKLNEKSNELIHIVNKHHEYIASKIYELKREVETISQDVLNLNRQFEDFRNNSNQQSHYIWPQNPQQPYNNNNRPSNHKKHHQRR